MQSEEKYVAFLRGINVGGHHKVPMADLQSELRKINLKNIITLLNSGNVLFESNENDLENKISTHLEKVFGFQIPTIIRRAEMIIEMLNNNPFKDIEITQDIRLYVSFLKNESSDELTLPWKSADNSYEIIGITDNTIFSVLDVSISKTPEAMATLTKYFGKEITTRNWNTISRIRKLVG
jgi:uncharacterized protein (DUF1697 family)